MGGPGLPRGKSLAALIVGALLLVMPACSGDDDDAVPTAALPPATPPATSTRTRPTQTATPDPLGPPPASTAAAIAGIEAVLDPGEGDCPAVLVQRWGVTCREGDVDGDGSQDALWLVPLVQQAPVAPNPGVVLVRTGGTVSPISGEGSADASILGVSLFTVGDRDGAPGAEVTYLENLCTVAQCSSLVRVAAWDGAAWRDIGPADQGIINIDRAVIEGTGMDSRIVVHGGSLTTPSAGPGRASTFTYTLADGRFGLASRDPDPPVYLFHAIVDADGLMAAGLLDEAIEGYRAAVEDEALRDWPAEHGRGPGRPALESYALFRIALATAAMGDDPAPALDTVITTAPEVVFRNAAEVFRRGFQEGGGVSAGCIEVTRYLATTGPGVDTPRYVARLFDYGYANPQLTYRDICPL